MAVKGLINICNPSKMAEFEYFVHFLVKEIGINSEVY